MPRKRARSARERTDARLTAERAKTDQELARRTRATANRADEVVKTARRRAAAVVEVARRRADVQLRARKAPSAERSRVDAERSRQDAVLRNEYARADRVTAAERAERARLVAELLHHERRDTDRSLLLERADADATVGRRDEFLSMVSHDLRNELTAVGLSIAQILANVPNDKRGRTILRCATNVQRANLRMNRLIGDLLDVASIAAGKFAVIPEDHDLSAAVDDVIESLAAIASAKGVALVVTGKRGPLAACFDRQRIQQALANLVMNALKYTSEGGRVSVSVARKGQEVRFTVADTGCGIAADRLPSIFEKFSRGTRSERSGLGLGLYITRRIVEAHGGRIWAESQPGPGSTFCFTLPVRAARRGPQRLPLTVASA